MINKIMNLMSFLLFSIVFLFGTVSTVAASSVNSEDDVLSLSQQNENIIERTICVEKDDLMNRLIYSTFSKDGQLSYNLKYLPFCKNISPDVPSSNKSSPLVSNESFGVPFTNKSSALVPSFFKLVVLFSLLIAMFYITYNSIELVLQQTKSGQFLGGNLDYIKTIKKTSLVFLCLVPGLGSKVVNPNPNSTSSNLDGDLNIATVITLSFYGFSNDVANSIWRSFLKFKISSTPKIKPKYSPLSKFNNKNALQDFLDCNLNMSHDASTIENLEISFYRNENYFKLDDETGPAYIIESSPVLSQSGSASSVNRCYLGVSPLKVNINPMMSKLKTMNDVLELSGLENIVRFESMNTKDSVVQYDKMFERIYNLETSYAEKIKDLVVEYLEMSTFSSSLIKKYTPENILSDYKSYYISQGEMDLHTACEYNHNSDYDQYFTRLDELRKSKEYNDIVELESDASSSQIGQDLFCVAKYDREFQLRINEYKTSLTKYYSQKMSEVLSDPSYKKSQGALSESVDTIDLSSCSNGDEEYKQCFESSCGEFVREASTIKSIMAYALAKKDGDDAQASEIWVNIQTKFFDEKHNLSANPDKAPLPFSKAASLKNLLSCSDFLTETEDYRHYKISDEKGWLMSAPYLYGFSHVNEAAAELFSSQSLTLSYSSRNFGSYNRVRREGVKTLYFYNTPGWMLLRAVTTGTSSDSTEFEKQNAGNEVEAQGSQFIEDKKELNKMLSTIFGPPSSCLLELDDESCPKNYFDKLRLFGKDAYLRFLKLKGFVFGLKLTEEVFKKRTLVDRHNLRDWITGTGISGFLAFATTEEAKLKLNEQDQLDENKMSIDFGDLSGDLGGGSDFYSFISSFGYLMEKTMFVETIEPFAFGVLIGHVAKVPLLSLSAAPDLIVGLLDTLASVFKWLFIISVLVLPLVPLAVWVMSVTSYLISLFSVLIIVPIWMGFMLSKESLNKSSEDIKNLYQLLFKLVLRAPFLVIGVLLSWYLLNFAGDLVLEPIIMLYESNVVELENLDAYSIVKYVMGLMVSLIFIVTIFLFLFVVIFKLLSLIDGIQSFAEDLLFEGSIVRPYGDDSASTIGQQLHTQSKK